MTVVTVATAAFIWWVVKLPEEKAQVRMSGPKADVITAVGGIEVRGGESVAHTYTDPMCSACALL